MSEINIIKEIETNQVEGTVLGQRVSTPTTYTPEVLVRVPRSENRDKHGISGEEMYGVDDWYAYECSTLGSNGVPHYFGLIITYDSASKYIVESKSLKLYLNSFNMEIMPSVISTDVQNDYISRVRGDLEKLLETPVRIERMTIQSFKDFNEGNFYHISSYIDTTKLSDLSYTEDSDLLKFSSRQEDQNFSISFNGFRSNCKVTHAPDFGTMYISYQGTEGVDLESLYRYLASFRNESHFHEECVEMVYNSLFKKYAPKKLFVRCNYVRRGGIDINPSRHNILGSNKPRSRTIFQ